VTGIEPATSTLARLRSSQLSYTRASESGPLLNCGRASNRLERRGWDSNPRYPFRGTRDFQSRPFDHSGTSPSQPARAVLPPGKLRSPGCGAPMGFGHGSGSGRARVDGGWMHRSRATGERAERVGFEPTVPFWGTHDFESCAFNRTRPPLPRGAVYPSPCGLATAAHADDPRKRRRPGREAASGTRRRRGLRATVDRSPCESARPTPPACGVAPPGLRLAARTRRPCTRRRLGAPRRSGHRLTSSLRGGRGRRCAAVRPPPARRRRRPPRCDG
jgi:hypothetical protein